MYVPAFYTLFYWTGATKTFFYNFLYTVPILAVEKVRYQKWQPIVRKISSWFGPTKSLSLVKNCWIVVIIKMCFYIVLILGCSAVWGLQRSCAGRKWRWRYQPTSATYDHCARNTTGPDHEVYLRTSRTLATISFQSSTFMLKRFFSTHSRMVLPHRQTLPKLPLFQLVKAENRSLTDIDSL